MTRNAIAWLEYNENVRANKANTAENVRHNTATETEVARHNQASEMLDLGSLNETRRHNTASETELNRHNVASESENTRHNTTTENETNRHNVATESIDLGRVNESIRHNKVTESQNQQNINENIRHNTVTESQQQQGISETIRHNQVSEGLAHESNMIASERNAIQNAYNNAMISAKNFENALKQVDQDTRNTQSYKRLQLEGLELINNLNQSKFHNAADIVKATSTLGTLLSRLQNLGGN